MHVVDDWCARMPQAAPAWCKVWVIVVARREGHAEGERLFSIVVEELASTQPLCQINRGIA